MLAYLGEEVAGKPSGRFPVRRAFETLGEDESIQDLLKYRYFTRVWIIQKLVLPRQIVFTFRGSEYWVDRATTAKISWPVCLKASLKSRTSLELLPYPVAFDDVLKVESAEEEPSNPVQWLQDHLAGQSLTAVGLLDAMKKTWPSSATDIRDKVFGILGLLDASNHAFLRPNYAASAMHIFTSLTAHCILNLQHANTFLVNSIDIKGWNKQPSWAPNWTVTDRWPLRRTWNFPTWTLETDELSHVETNRHTRRISARYCLVFSPRYTGSVDQHGGLHLYLLHICSLERLAPRTTATPTVFRTQLGKYAMFLESDVPLDKVVDAESDHLFYIDAHLFFIVRKTDEENYRIVTHVRRVFLMASPLEDGNQRTGPSCCQNLALMANCGDCCVLLLFCGRESLACRVPYCQAGYFREWLQLLI